MFRHFDIEIQNIKIGGDTDTTDTVKLNIFFLGLFD